MSFYETFFLIGESHRPEFCGAAVSCKEYADMFRLRLEHYPAFSAVPGLGTAGSVSAEFCRFALFLESYPGEYSVAEVRDFRARYPLTPILFLAGPLCEGEARTGTLPQGIHRLYWYEWDFLGRRELTLFFQYGKGRFAFPFSATDEDYFRTGFFENSRMIAEPQNLRFTKSAESSLCFIVSPDPGMRELLVSLEKESYDSVRFYSRIDSLKEKQVSTAEIPKKIVIDSFERDGRDLLPLLLELESVYPSVSFDILLFSPNPEEVQQIKAAVKGVRVLPKPFEIDWFRDQ